MKKEDKKEKHTESKKNIENHNHYIKAGEIAKTIAGLFFLPILLIANALRKHKKGE